MDYPIRTLQQIRPLLVGFRKRSGLSQAEVATLLGVTQQSYAKIELNPAFTSVERLFTILRLLGGEIVLSLSEDPDADEVPEAQPEQSSKPALPAAAPKLKRARVAAPAKVAPPSKKTERW